MGRSADDSVRRGRGPADAILITPVPIPLESEAYDGHDYGVDHSAPKHGDCGYHRYRYQADDLLSHCAFVFPAP